MEVLDYGDIVEHYEGEQYTFVSWAKHTETAELLMVYRTMDGEKTFAKPYSLFYDMKENAAGDMVPCFSKLSRE